MLPSRGPFGGTAAGGSVTWQFQGLTSGTNGSHTLDSGLVAYGTTPTWATDGTGQYVSVAYSASAGGLSWSLPSFGQTQVYVKVDMRRNTLLLHSKYCKFRSWYLDYGGGNYSNMTFGNGYSTEAPSIGYGDNVSGNNDQGIAYNWDGTSGGTFTRATPTLANSTSYTYDTSWHTYEYFVKQNSDNTADGIVAIRIDQDNAKRFILTNMYNASNGSQSFGSIGIGEWSNNSGFTEDFRNLGISFDKPSWVP